jgi:hypothetical protein
MSTGKDPVSAPGLYRERVLVSANGYLLVAIGALLMAVSIGSFFVAPLAGGAFGIVLRVLLALLGGFLLAGLYMLQPSESA